MKTTKTTKLDLCLPDLEDIINEYLLLKMGYSECDGKRFNWKVITKSCPSDSIYDSVDVHAFDGVEVTITEE